MLGRDFLGLYLRFYFTTIRGGSGLSGGRGFGSPLFLARFLGSLLRGQFGCNLLFGLRFLSKRSFRLGLSGSFRLRLHCHLGLCCGGSLCLGARHWLSCRNGFLYRLSRCCLIRSFLIRHSFGFRISRDLRGNGIFLRRSSIRRRLRFRFGRGFSLCRYSFSLSSYSVRRGLRLIGGFRFCFNTGVSLGLDSTGRVQDASDSTLELLGQLFGILHLGAIRQNAREYGLGTFRGTANRSRLREPARG